MAEPIFDRLYSSLNPEQRQAVDAIEGPVMVVAGPGTGKTQILALRIANILLKTDVGPSSILALTFTESGVYSMRRRLVDIIGAPAYKINIYTFHSFCNMLISVYPDEFPRLINAVAVSDIEQIQIIEELLAEDSFEYIRPYGDPSFYVRPILGAIRTLKRENVSPKDFETLVKKQQKDFKAIPDLIHEKGAHKGKMKGEYATLQKNIEKNAELAKIYTRYEETLTVRKYYDYEDMILEAIRAMSTNPDFLLQLQENFQYILADEHQDANASQNKILELLSNFHSEPNLFIVGDEKQAIFRFQGASLDNFLYFKKLYPTAQIISLKNNYRSTQTILDAAHSLIGKNTTSDESLRVRLMAAGATAQHVAPISVAEFSETEYELQFLIEDIKKHLTAGVEPSEIACIYRENKDADQIVRALQKAGIEYSIQSDQNIIQDADIRKLLSLFDVVVHPGEEEYLVQALAIDFLKIEPLNVFKITSWGYTNKQSLYDVIHSEHYLHDAGVKDVQVVIEVAQKISQWQTLAKNDNAVEVFETILYQSGFLESAISQAGALDLIAKVDRLFVEARRLIERTKHASLADFVNYLSTLQKYNVLLKAGEVGSEHSGVRLMTAHRSKGLEFEYVYIVGAYDTHWGNKREFSHFKLPLSQTIFDPIEDERRLFYVALTRAKKAAIISFAQKSFEGKEQLPAQFISELTPEQVTNIDVTKLEKHYAEHPETKYTVKQYQGLNIDDKKFLRSIFLEQGLSATGLNRYLTCPWDYFFTTLLHIPEADTKFQMYGTAIHAALQAYFNAYAEKNELSSEQAIAIFTDRLSKLPLNNTDRQEVESKGKEALKGYFKAYKGTWPRDIKSEIFISGASLPFSAGNLPLRGKIDKLEYLSQTEVSVVDYKTGKPRSRNELLGLTKNSTGDYFRQLVFYKILLEGYEQGQLNLKQAMIDFIEPDDKGKYHREVFEITDEHVAELKTLLQKTAQEIYNFEFWQKTCDDKDCRFCKLRSFIVDRS